jgi:hypothetical protein
VWRKATDLVTLTNKLSFTELSSRERCAVYERSLVEKDKRQRLERARESPGKYKQAPLLKSFFSLSLGY